MTDHVQMKHTHQTTKWLTEQNEDAKYTTVFAISFQSVFQRKIRVLHKFMNSSVRIFQNQIDQITRKMVVKIE